MDPGLEGSRATQIRIRSQGLDRRASTVTIGTKSNRTGVGRVIARPDHCGPASREDPAGLRGGKLRICGLRMRSAPRSSNAA
jgi:hypothetical protein